ncbi:MAG: hypothetical protein JW780_02290 [Clostridiales bacterium]|nr:hypothetical protein [Clostridiales bacterium]
MSEGIGNNRNQERSKEKVSDGKPDYRKDSGRRNDYSNRRRRGTDAREQSPQTASDRSPMSENRKGNENSSSRSGSGDRPQGNNRYNKRRRGPRPDASTNQDKSDTSNQNPAGNRHITREIRPDDPRKKQNSDNRDNRNKSNNPNYNKQRNRNDRRPDKRGEQKNWSRRIRAEETSEDIRKDNERIEKEIWLEIAGIHTMKLD